jgi:hypothetical protein
LSGASNSNGQWPEAESGLPRHPVLLGPKARRTRGKQRRIGTQTTAGTETIVTACAVAKRETSVVG